MVTRDCKNNLDVTSQQYELRMKGADDVRIKEKKIGYGRALNGRLVGRHTESKPEMT